MGLLSSYDRAESEKWRSRGSAEVTSRGAAADWQETPQDRRLPPCCRRPPPPSRSSVPVAVTTGRGAEPDPPPPHTHVVEELVIKQEPQQDTLQRLTFKPSAVIFKEQTSVGFIPHWSVGNLGKPS